MFGYSDRYVVRIVSYMVPAKKAEASGHKNSPFRDEQLTDALRSELITMNFIVSTANVALKFE